MWFLISSVQALNFTAQLDSLKNMISNKNLRMAMLTNPSAVDP